MALRRVVIAAAVGCAGGCRSISADEATAFLAVHTDVLDWLQSRLDEIEELDVARHTSDGDYLYQGEIVGDPFDGGRIAVDGTGSMQYGATLVTYDLALDYDALVYRDQTFDGSLDAQLELDFTDGLTKQHHASGMLELDGAIRGTADFDYTLVVRAAGDVLDEQYTGTVAGREITD